MKRKTRGKELRPKKGAPSLYAKDAKGEWRRNPLTSEEHRVVDEAIVNSVFGPEGEQNASF